ncbi:DoxX family protein [Lichenicoccus roseus]|uniref:DoxX family protein n=1 Tax=Lichenicoccus roseus TaxID=2683649 RepID=A0A5R9J447_9PROT|nr:DoxX family protein [Lichenicoccus roseus]TLU72390.1 hypothetical protein FE263_09955 [Lichenicoccus roseus]
MSKYRPSIWHSIIGLGFAAAGISKLLAVAPQRELFESWGWSKRDMQTIGASELLGAALVVTRSTQRVGAVLLSASSLCVLTTELRHGNDALVTPRTGMLLAALSGLLKIG